MLVKGATYVVLMGKLWCVYWEFLLRKLLMLQCGLTVYFWVQGWPWPRLSIKMIFSGMGISIILIRQLWDCLIFIMGIRILVRWYCYIDGPGWSITSKFEVSFPWLCLKSLQGNLLWLILPGIQWKYTHVIMYMIGSVCIMTWHVFWVYFVNAYHNIICLW